MDILQLTAQLRSREQELHTLEVRRNAARLNELLHPDFEEFGRSGERWSRAAVIEEFANGGTLPPIAVDDFDVALLGADVALVTYVSSHVAANGARSRRTLRSSVWWRDGAKWRLRFHQGTPAAGEE